MADIDIDKILEQSEKKDEKKEAESKLKIILPVAGGVMLLAVIALVVIMAVLGERSTKYFPLDTEAKYVYNRMNLSPEQWSVLEKKEELGGFECTVINKIDQGNYFSKQEFYYAGKNGIVRVGYSKNFGKKRVSKFGMLPAKIKEGTEFTAGKTKSTVIKGTIIGKETVSTPLGEYDAVKVTYKAGRFMDKTMWYAKGVGIIKIVDSLRNKKTDIISMEE